MQAPLLSPFSPSLPHSAKERWICIYPSYINSRKTRAQGRKLATENCVDHPKSSEVTLVLGKLSFDYLLETKVHPRERDALEPMSKWRIRVQLKNDDGLPLNAQFPTRHSLLLYLGKTILILRSRRPPGASGIGSTDQGYLNKKGKKKRK